MSNPHHVIVVGGRLAGSSSRREIARRDRDDIAENTEYWRSITQFLQPLP